MKVILTVEDRGIDYGPVLEYLKSKGYDCNWQPLNGGGNDELIETAKGAHAVIAGMEHWNNSVMEVLAGDLKIIARYGIGYDRVDLEAAARLGIAVTNTPGVLSEGVAELTLALFLCLSRSIVGLNNRMHSGDWGAVTGHDIYQKTVGLIGFGSISRRFAQLLQPFDCRLLATDPYLDHQAAAALGVQATGLEELLREADCVSLHLPCTPETENMVEYKFLQQMKPSAFLINTSRGGLVDENALAEALQSNRIVGAALDVFCSEPLPDNHPFLGLPNLIMTPHIGSASQESFLRAGFCAAESVHAVLSGGMPLNSVL